MASYLIKLTPLEPYFFGGERNFSFGKSKKETKPSYYIKSLEAPSQTTLLGALRYAVLAASNALITDYGDALQREKCKELVGKIVFHLRTKENTERSTKYTRFSYLKTILTIFLPP